MNEDKLIEEQLKKLPVELQKALETSNWRQTIAEIALVSQLNKEKVEILERETMLLLYGFEPPQNYTQNIINETQLNEEVALNIANQVAERIMKPIEAQVEKIKLSSPKETKEDAMNRLKDRMQMGKASEVNLSKEKQEPVENLPMVEPGEVVHEVPHVEEVKPAQPAPQPQPAPVPESKSISPTPTIPSKSDYAGGQDPYREPLN